MTRSWPHPIVNAVLLALLATALVSARDTVRNYTVLLDQPAVNQILPATTRKGDRQIRLGQPQLQELTLQAEAAQQPIKNAIRTLGVEITGSVCHTLNAVFIRATKEQAEQLKLLPGVKRVDRARRFKLLTNAAITSLKGTGSGQGPVPVPVLNLVGDWLRAGPGARPHSCLGGDWLPSAGACPRSCPLINCSCRCSVSRCRGRPWSVGDWLPSAGACPPNLRLPSLAYSE